MVLTARRVCCGVICEGLCGISSSGGRIDMVDGLCIRVEM